jgi:chromosome segregation ATPase
MAATEPLTPAQQQLKDANHRFNQTVGEGALVGALIGGVLGAALGGRSALQMAALGASAGALIGGAAGYGVASKNLAQAHTEENLKKAIAEANQDALAYQRSATASEQIAADAQSKIALLDQQYKQKTISAAQYQRSLQSYRESADIMRKQLTQMDQETASLRADATTVSPADAKIMIASAHDIEAARTQERQNLKALEDVLSAVPAG